MSTEAIRGRCLFRTVSFRLIQYKVADKVTFDAGGSCASRIEQSAAATVAIKDSHRIKSSVVNIACGSTVVVKQ